jgi:hypothetical protein
LIYGDNIKMAASKENRGGAGRGQGRKPLKPGESSVPVNIRMSVSQRDKLLRLGGARWVRDRVDRAKDPKE